MDKIERFKEAKAAIFGPKPTEPLALVGYNMDVCRYETEIQICEPLLMGQKATVHHIPALLRNAFNAHTDPCFRGFPDETKKVFEGISTRFRERYTKLYEQYVPKAA